MRVWVMVGLLLALTSTAQCEDNDLVGYGASTCADFGKRFQQNPDIAEAVYYAWALGLMSGMNIGARVQGLQPRNLTGTPQNDQRRFIRQWCDGHPLASYYSAVIELIKTLPVMAP